MTASARPRRAASPKPLEAEVQKRCIQLLESHGWKVIRRNTGRMSWTDSRGKDRRFAFGVKGASDLEGWIIGVGRHFECEVKRPGERPTRAQAEWLLEAHNGNCVAFWVDSRDALARVVMHINRGGSIRYLGTRRTYAEKVKGVKGTVKIEGPSGDYELV